MKGETREHQLLQVANKEHKVLRGEVTLLIQGHSGLESRFPDSQLFFLLHSRVSWVNKELCATYNTILLMKQTNCCFVPTLCLKLEIKMGMTLILKVFSSALFITLKIMELAVLFLFYSCGNKRRSKTFHRWPKIQFQFGWPGFIFLFEFACSSFYLNFRKNWSHLWKWKCWGRDRNKKMESLLLISGNHKVWLNYPIFPSYMSSTAKTVAIHEMTKERLRYINM